MKYYEVTLTTGDWDGMSWRTVFITDKAYKAQWYCSRGNAMLENHKPYYENIQTILDKHPRLANEYCHFSERKELVNGLFSFSEVEFRSNIKTKK